MLFVYFLIAKFQKYTHQKELTFKFQELLWNFLSHSEGRHYLASTATILTIAACFVVAKGRSAATVWYRLQCSS
jgi:hypothetical protein